MIRGFKFLLAMPRPAAVLPLDSFILIGPTLKLGSMPSGHSATAFGFAAVIFLLSQKRSIRVTAVCLATLVGLTRILLGAHWPTDVLVGAAIGWISGYLGVMICNRLAWPHSMAAYRTAAVIVICFSVGLLFVRYDAPVQALIGWMLFAIGIFFAATNPPVINNLLTIGKKGNK